jgi:hypothetical protein
MDFGDEEPHSASSSAHSAMSAMDHDSLEDLHRQQDAEFQELLADFADQQYELEQRKPSTSNTSLSLSSVVSNEDTSESSCGTLSEIFESLSRFSEHCLASVEALSSPIYLNSSSFTTTPTGPGDNFGFDFDYAHSSLRGRDHDNFLIGGRVRREDFMEERQQRRDDAILMGIGDRQRERDLMLQNHEPRRRHSSVIEGELRFDLSEAGPSSQSHQQNRARAEFFRSILECQNSGDDEGCNKIGGGSDTGGPSKASSSAGQVLLQGNQSQSQPQEGLSESCSVGGPSAVTSSSAGNASSRGSSKNMSVDIGLELEIFSAGLELGNIMGVPGVPSTSVERASGGGGGAGGDLSLCEGAAGENSIVAALSILRDSGPLVSALDWQERCMELELALQRFGEQAARVRLILRDKVRIKSFSWFIILFPPSYKKKNTRFEQ